jgi:hypothetical protein
MITILIKDLESFYFPSLSFPRQGLVSGHPSFVARFFWIPAFQTVLRSFLVIASDRRESGNLYVFSNL